MTYRQFEDLPIWQSGRKLVKMIYLRTDTLKDYGLRDQMRRCAVSYLSNISEGFERGSNKEFIQFLYMARGSLGELRSQLYIAYDIGFLAKWEFEESIHTCIDLSRSTSNFIAYLRNSPLTNIRHKSK